MEDLIKYHLVTTECDETWSKEGNNFFLGHWCKRFDEEEKWRSVRHVISDFNDVDVKQRFLDIEYCDQIGDSLLEALSASLNELHGNNYSQKFWSILLGHWMQLYVKTMYSRYKSIKYALRKFDLSSSTFIQEKKSYIAAKDTLEFNSFIQDRYWNQLIYQRILKKQNYCGVVNYVEVHFPERKILKNFSLKYKVKKSLKTIIFGFLQPLFSRPTDAVILNTYLPRKEEFLLQLLLGQVPQWWQSLEMDRYPYDESLRKKINVTCDSEDDFVAFVTEQIPVMIPRVFVEGFKDSLIKVSNLKWPKKPKFIFTSNNFAFDECFKFYTAIKAELSGAKYFVGQHGSNYGTYRGSERWPEVTNPDGFISWGWCPNLKGLNVYPAFNFKVSDQKSLKKCDSLGKLLIIKRGPGTRDGPQDRNYEHIVYQKRVFDFFEKLTTSIQSKTIVRLHHGSQSLNSSDRILWEKHKDRVELNLGFGSIWPLIHDSRLIIHTYDSTTFLETLTLNLPTVGIWREGLDHLDESAKPFYQRLVDVGIIYLDVESAARCVNSNWSSIESWWKNPQLQEQRIIFCNKFAIEVTRPAAELVKVLNSAYSGHK